MIRERELVTYLESMRDELAGPVRAELSTDFAKKIVDSMILVIRRLIMERGEGREVASQGVDQWQRLAAEISTLVPGSASGSVEEQGSNGPLARIDRHTSDIQAVLQQPGSFEVLVAQLQRREPGASRWLADAARALNGILQRMEDGLEEPKQHGAAPRQDENVDALRQGLAAYLRRRYPELPEDPITRFAIAPGGQIKRTALFQLADNPVLPSRLVLRQDMAFNFTGTVVTDEFRILERVHELGLPVPRPLLVEDDAEQLGGRFMVMTEIVEAEPAGTYFPEERAVLGHAMGPQFGHEVAGALARLHRLTREDDAEAGLAAERDRNEAIAKLRESWRAMGKPAFSIGMDLALAWLESHPLPRDRPRCLTHRDVGAHNMLARDGHLAALLDWELAQPGDPAEDIGQAKMMLLPDIMPWDEFRRSYVEQGGPPEAIEDHAVHYYSIWTYVRHGSMNAQLCDWFFSGQRTDAPAASIAGHFLERLMLYVSRALADATAAMD